MDIQDLIVLGKTGFYSASGAFLATVLGCYKCNIYPNYDWKAAGIWGSIGAFLGTHYYIANYHPRRYN